MRKLTYSILLLAFGAFVLSCKDDALDPLKTKEVKKGTILALRGTQLNNIYFDGVPGAEFFPRVIQGTETFDFDAEFLSEDPKTLESFDMYVLKKTKTADGTTTERVFLRNVPFSEFKETDDYSRPWVSVSIKLTDIFEKIGITDYTDPDVVDMLLDLYQPGIDIQSDLNLTDGSKVPASIILASGLFDSDQFYPAQKLTYNSTEFCPYEETWVKTYKTVELFESGEVSDFYNSSVTLTTDGSTEDEYLISNFKNDVKGYSIKAVFGEATTNPSQQTITVAEQTLANGWKVSGDGMYDQCSGTFAIHILIVDKDDEETEYDWQFEPK